MLWQWRNGVWILNKVYVIGMGPANMTIYSLHIVLTFFPATLVGLVLEGILLLGISLTIVSICVKPFFSNISAVK